MHHVKRRSGVTWLMQEIAKGMKIVFPEDTWHPQFSWSCSRTERGKSNL